MDRDVRVCATCGAEFVTVTGAELCRKCRNKARSRELYNERKSAGLCTQCGAPALDTRIHCEWCAKSMAIACRRYYIKSIANGKCAKYHKPLPNGYQKECCETCLAKQKEYHMRRRKT